MQLERSKRKLPKKGKSLKEKKKSCYKFKFIFERRRDMGYIQTGMNYIQECYERNLQN